MRVKISANIFTRPEIRKHKYFFASPCVSSFRGQCCLKVVKDELKSTFYACFDLILNKIVMHFKLLQDILGLF
jgi:hypothetical protein